MRNTFKIAVAASSALVFAWLAASPYIAVSDFQRALQHGDIDAVKESVDFPRLREDLRAKALHEVNESVGAEMRRNPGVALGIMLGTPMLNDAVDSLFTPQYLVTSAQSHEWDDSNPAFATMTGLSRLMIADKESAALYSSHYQNWGRFVVRYPLTPAKATEIVEVVWVRSGLASWHVSSVDVALDGTSHRGLDSGLPSQNGSMSLSKSSPLPDPAAPVVAQVLGATQDDSYDIRRLRWGMSVAQVAAVEPEATESAANPQTLLIDDSFAGIPATISLICDETNGLNSMLIVPKSETLETLAPTFRVWHDELDRRYGTGYIAHSQDGHEGQVATPEEVTTRLNRFSSEAIQFAVKYRVNSRSSAYVGVMHSPQTSELFSYLLFDSRFVHP